MPFADPNPEYWHEYTNLQHVKHELIRCYLQGWLPKLGFWAGRVVYFDTHAGRGKYATGKLGSPLVALDTLLSHSHRDEILKRSDVQMIFIERNKENAGLLEAELANRGTLPSRISCQTYAGECFSILQELIDGFSEPTRRLAPALFFIDPYGFKVPGSMLRDLMQFQRVELFINVIWRELDMAMAQPDKMEGTLNEVFDGDIWKGWSREADAVTRAHMTVEGLKAITNARWATYIRMLGDNQATRYLLVHLTNHDAGRDLIKDCIWKICPDGGFYARKSDDPQQEFLIKPSPDLSRLQEWVVKQLPCRWSLLTSELRRTLWRKPQLNETIRNLRKCGAIGGSDYEGRFSEKSNPELFLL